MKILSKYFYLIISVAVVSCNGNNRAFTTQDSWYNPPPSSFTMQGWNVVEDSLVYLVPATKNEMAELILNKVDIAELNNTQVKEMLGNQTNLASRSNYFLLRAVYLGSSTHGFKVHISNDSIIVIHGSLGHEAVPMKRTALIIPLLQKPNVLFTQCFRDE